MSGFTLKYPAMNWPQRVQQLLARLEERALQCPGLYPVQSAADFQRLVKDHVPSAAGEGRDPSETIANWLEELWRSPELSYQLNAQSLIRRGASPFGAGSEKAKAQKLAG